MSINPKDIADQRTDEVNASGTPVFGFADPSGAFPRTGYISDVSTNKSSRGRDWNALEIGGGFNDIPVENTGPPPSEYPHADVNETTSGHIIEVNDTPGGERILIMHKSGAGIDIRPDGSVIVNSQGDMATVVSGNNISIVEGEATIQSNGNLNLNVQGDLNLNVGGNINTTVGGSKSETVNGSSRELVYGQSGSIVSGSRSVTTVGTVTNSSLGGKNDITKGDYRQTVAGDMKVASSGSTKMSAEGDMSVSTPNMNMSAQSMSIFGATGTIGGSGITMYAQNVFGTSGTFTEGVTSPTFHGELDGKAKDACKSDFATLSAGTGADPVTVISPDTPTNSTATAWPTADLIEIYLGQAQGGVGKVVVDEGDFIKNMIDQTVNNGGVSDRILSTEEVRSRMRDEANRANEEFVGNQLANGVLGGSYANPVPGGVRRTSGAGGSVRTPTYPISPNGAGDTGARRFIPNKNLEATSFTPNPAYDVMKLYEEVPIGPGLNLEDGIQLGKFLGGTGERTTLDHLESRAEKLVIARQLQMQAAAMKTIHNDRNEFVDHRLVVVEGFYKPGESETVTPDGLNDLATKGRVVVYELHGPDGKIDLDKSYDLALYWKDFVLYDKLILDYDTYAPDGSLNVQLILVMPEVDQRWQIVSGKYANEISTYFNNNVQSGNELVELTLDASGNPKPVEQTHKVATNGVNPDLVYLLEKTGNEVGVSVVTTSGYRGAGGSGRHNGDASDVALYKDGRRLTVTRDDDLVIIQRFTAKFADNARSMGHTPSAGVANRDYDVLYMSGNTFHYDIAVGNSIGSGRGRYWGGSGTRSKHVPAPDWLITIMQ